MLCYVFIVYRESFKNNAYPTSNILHTQSKYPKCKWKNYPNLTTFENRLCIA